MMTLTKTMAALALALPLALASIEAAPAQDNDCVGERMAQPLVEEGSVLGIVEAMRREGIQKRPTSVQLCDVDGSPYWLVNLTDEYGEAERKRLNAQVN